MNFGMRAVWSMAIAATLAGAAWPACAQTSALTGASAEITAPASISASQNLVFTLTTAAGLSGVTSSGLAAGFVLTGAPGDTVSVSAPASFNVTSNNGGAILTVRTSPSVGDFLGGRGGAAAGGTDVTGVLSGGLFNSRVQVVGRLDRGQLSFSIGGAVTVANALTPGDYHGVLTVIAQYN